jgi:hypothetical protein
MLGDGMDLKQFAYAEIEGTEIGGTVDIKVSYRGSKGSYQEILQKRILAVTDRYQYEQSPFADEIEKLGFLNTQYRRLVTESATRKPSYVTCESPYTADIDKAFTILIEWCGEFGVEIVRQFQDPWNEKSVGSPSSNETTSCVVGETGDSISVDLKESPYDTGIGDAKSWYAKVYKTVNVPCSNSPSSVSATASATYLSFISYAHAEEEAGVLALQAANAAAQQYKAQNPC